MKISEILNIIKEKRRKHFEYGKVQSYEHDYWVDIIIDGGFFGKINSLLDDLTGELSIDKNELMIWTSEELKESIGIGFFLPYLRRLCEDEVRAKYVYVESDFKEYVPPIRENLYIISEGKRYDTYLDENSRLFLTRWFNDNPAKPGDIVSLWCIEWMGKYRLYLKRQSTQG
ncbi:MAG: hypothetical protein HXX80_00365 [Nitrososphaerales archaeon]|nr:hypothetical protein [Nitrososphaerales archaeon]